MKISVFGTGYVGLVTGTCFADMGNEVVCVDIDAAKVAMLNRGEVPIFEPGLAAMVRRNSDHNLLSFSSDIQAGVEHGDIIFIAVGTPEGEDGSADLTYVLNVAASIGEYMTTEKVVVDKSTVPVGTADKVSRCIRDALDARAQKIPFHIVSNPEFLKEGAAVNDFMKPDRVVIGTDSTFAKEVMTQLYAPFNRNHDKLVHMDARSAELTKYAANVMLAARISLMNEIANIADHLDADIEAVRHGIGLDPRIGHHFLYAGTGYGGSCFPKDVQALVHTAQEHGCEALIMRAVDAVNDQQKLVLFNKLMSHFEDDINRKCFAMWGLAFKPNTDDMREAPSVKLIEALTAQGARVQAYDPEANDPAARIFEHNDGFSTCPSTEETLSGADGLVVVTEWNEFRSADFSQVVQQLSTPVVFDGRNLYDPESMRALGVTYYGIGRGQPS